MVECCACKEVVECCACEEVVECCACKEVMECRGGCSIIEGGGRKLSGNLTTPILSHPLINFFLVSF